MSLVTLEEAKQDAAYKEALLEVLYQFADDDFIISYRGSEWLGLAPHIEEDVAFSSITQNTMGHANLFYQLLEELEEGDADALAHERLSNERRNGTYFEIPNGTGTYLEEPRYDWALAVVRNYLYEVFKKVKLEAALESSYEPLRHAAEKVLMEQPYHLGHWRTWITQLQDASPEAKERIQARLDEAWKQIGDAFELGPKADDIVQKGILPSSEVLEERWLEIVKETLSYVPSGSLGSELGNGRAKEHTADLDDAIKILSEVYNLDREAVW